MLIAYIYKFCLPLANLNPQLAKSLCDLILDPGPLIVSGLPLVLKPPLPGLYKLYVLIIIELPIGDLLGLQLHGLPETPDLVRLVPRGHALAAQLVVVAGVADEAELLEGVDRAQALGQGRPMGALAAEVTRVVLVL